MLVLLFAAACTTSSSIDTGKPAKDSADSGGADSGVDENAPTIASASATCSTNTDDEPIWIIEATAHDPQGDETLDGGTVGLYQNDPAGGGSALDEQPVVCVGSGSGAYCTASWEGSAQESCTIVGKVWIRLVVLDDDGNSSEPYDFKTS